MFPSWRFCELVGDSYPISDTLRVREPMRFDIAAGALAVEASEKGSAHKGCRSAASPPGSQSKHSSALWKLRQDSKLFRPGLPK